MGGLTWVFWPEGDIGRKGWIVDSDYTVRNNHFFDYSGSSDAKIKWVRAER